MNARQHIQMGEGAHLRPIPLTHSLCCDSGQPSPAGGEGTITSAAVYQPYCVALLKYFCRYFGSGGGWFFWIGIT